MTIRSPARRLLSAVKRTTSSHHPDGTPRWRSPFQLTMATLAAVIVALPLLWVLFGETAKLSLRERTTAEILAFTAMIGLSIGSFLAVNGDILNVLHLRSAPRYGRAVPDIDWIIAFHNLTASTYRALGKLALVFAMGILVLAQNDAVRTWLVRHPLLLPALLFASMGLFAVVDAIVVAYRRQTRRTPAPITIAGAVEENSRRIERIEAEHGFELRLLKQELLSLRTIVNRELLPSDLPESEPAYEVPEVDERMPQNPAGEPPLPEPT